jgi:hypothetical protein
MIDLKIKLDVYEFSAGDDVNGYLQSDKTKYARANDTSYVHNSFFDKNGYISIIPDHELPPSKHVGILPYISPSLGGVLSSISINRDLDTFFSYICKTRPINCAKLDGGFYGINKDTGVIMHVPENKRERFFDEYTKDYMADNINGCIINSRFAVALKTGKFVNKVLDLTMFETNYHDAITEMSDKIKAKFDKGEIAVYSGKALVDKYHYSNYYKDGGGERGSLWSSCMRSDDQQEYLSFYAKNHRSVSMVCIEKGGKVCARALVWKNVEMYQKIDGVIKKSKVTLMDRIYYIDDSSVDILQNWGLEKGYVTKARQSYEAKHKVYLSKENRDASASSLVVLKKTINTKEVDTFPYIDTFSYRNGDTFCNRPLAMKDKMTNLRGGMESMDDGEESRINLGSGNMVHINDLAIAPDGNLVDKRKVTIFKGKVVSTDDIAIDSFTNRKHMKEDLVISYKSGKMFNDGDGVNAEGFYVHKSEAIWSKSEDGYIIDAVYSKSLESMVPLSKYSYCPVSMDYVPNSEVKALPVEEEAVVEAEALKPVNLNESFEELLNKAWNV